MVKEKFIPYVLSAIGAAGVIATALLSAKNTKKYLTMKPVTDKKEKCKQILKTYWPTMATGVITVGSIIISGGKLQKTQTALAGASLLLNANRAKLDQYKDKVKELVGIETHDKVIESISEDDYNKCVKKIASNLTSKGVIYKEEHIGFFIAEPLKLEKAMNMLNERIHSVINNGVTNDDETNHYASLKNLFIDSEAVDANDNDIIDKESFDYGWSENYLAEAYDDTFVHPIYKEHKNKNGDVDFVLISFDKSPVFEIKNNGEVYKND